MVRCRRPFGSEAKSLNSSTTVDTHNINTAHKTQARNQMTIRQKPNAFPIHHVGTSKLNPVRNGRESDDKRLRYKSKRKPKHINRKESENPSVTAETKYKNSSATADKEITTPSDVKPKVIRNGGGKVNQTNFRFRVASKVFKNNDKA